MISTIRSGFLFVWISTQSRLALPILVGLAFHTSILCGQEDPAFAGLKGLVMLDSSIPDFIAMSKLEDVIPNQDNRLENLLLFKKSSLQSRLKQTEAAQRAVLDRLSKIEVESMKLQSELKKNEAEAQSKSYLYSRSKASAEQLLIAAQLELQKVTWELAAEQEILDIAVKDEESPKKLDDIERELAQIDLRSIEAEIEDAEKQLADMPERLKKGAATADDVAKANQALTKSKYALRIQKLRFSELEAKQEALKNAQSAGIKSQIRKLTARKKQIQKDMNDLFSSINDLNQREQIAAQIESTQKTISANQQLRDQLEYKHDEIQLLLDQLNTVELGGKKKD
jgi:hypothetical protein